VQRIRGYTRTSGRHPAPTRTQNNRQERDDSENKPNVDGKADEKGTGGGGRRHTKQSAPLGTATVGLLPTLPGLRDACCLGSLHAPTVHGGGRWVTQPPLDEAGQIMTPPVVTKMRQLGAQRGPMASQGLVRRKAQGLPRVQNAVHN